MFVTKRELARLDAVMESRFDKLHDKYWELWCKHEILLKHFGLVEVTTPKNTELRPKLTSTANRGPG